MEMCINHATADFDFPFERMSNGKLFFLNHFKYCFREYVLLNKLLLFTHDRKFLRS